MASTTSVATTTAQPRTCGQKEFPWRRLLLLASMVCYMYCVWVYWDIFYGAEYLTSASMRLQYYLIASIGQFFVLGFIACTIMTQPATTPSYDADDYPPPFLFKAICMDLPQLLLVLFPFFFALRVHEDRPTSEWFLFALLYIISDGVILIASLDANKSRYWLLLCVLTALVCTPFTGFSPHHPRLLTLKLVTALLSVVIAFLCGVVYVSHRRQEARLLQTPVPPATQSQPTIDTIV